MLANDILSDRLSVAEKHSIENACREAVVAYQSAEMAVYNEMQRKLDELEGALIYKYLRHEKRRDGRAREH